MSKRGVLAIAYCLLPIGYCLLSIAYCLLPIGYCLLSIAYCLLPIGYCLLLIAYCLLSIGYCLLPRYGYKPEDEIERLRGRPLPPTAFSRPRSASTRRKPPVNRKRESRDYLFNPRDTSDELP